MGCLDLLRLPGERIGVQVTLQQRGLPWNKAFQVRKLGKTTDLIHSYYNTKPETLKRKH